MKVTLYEALEIAPTATPAEVRGALRSLVRKYYARTRTEQVEIEEALRFINHASHILNDPARRARYDQEIASGEHISDSAARRDYLATMNALGLGEVASKPPEETVQEARPEPPSAARPSEKSQHFGLASSIARVRNNLPLQVVFGLLLIPLLLVLMWLVTPSNEMADRFRLLLLWLTALLACAGGIYGAVRVFAPGAKVELSAFSPALAFVTIAKWRRENTVFLGTHEPMEDQTWLFRLRMAELERARNHRTSEVHPWLRFLARMFDYGLWGLAYYETLWALVAHGVIRAGPGAALAHPLVAPMLVTASWIPLEIAFQACLQTTPGKWLFAVYVQYGVSRVMAGEDWPTRLLTCARRAVLIWWRGMACGLPLISLASMSLAKETLVRKHETTWDASEDCLVTQGRIGSVNAVTAMLAMTAFMWFYANAWANALRDTTGQAEALAQYGGDWWGRVRLQWPTLEQRSDAPQLVAAADQSAPDEPSPLDVKRKRWAEYQQEAERLGAARDWQGQVRVCTPWADEDYKNAAAWRCLGLARQALGQHKLAVAALQKASKLDPGDAEVKKALVRSFRAEYQH